MTSEKDAPAEVPGEEDIAKLISGAPFPSTKSLSKARAILALFAPILAEKERLERDNASLLKERAEAVTSALAAEAALAGLRQNILDAEVQSDDDDKAQARLDRLAAAIRAEGE